MDIYIFLPVLYAYIHIFENSLEIQIRMKENFSLEYCFHRLDILDNDTLPTTRNIKNQGYVNVNTINV